MSTPIQRKHIIIKELNQVSPKFYNFYSSLITNYVPHDNNISNSLNSIKYNFNGPSAFIDVLLNMQNNLPYEILYQKLIDPTFAEDKFSLFL